MTRRVLIISHADADGHVIAEQARRNLIGVPTFSVSTLVDPNRTAGHKMWTKLDQIPEIESHDIIFFVDLMFAPGTFAAEADALVEFAEARPTKRFFLFDHHPVPVRRLSRAANLRALYKRDVLDCSVGNLSWMMVVAALLEKQPTRAHEIKLPQHDQLAEGIRRAAAIGGPLPGEKLLALMRFNCWDELAELGREDKAAHRLPRGRRPAADPISPCLARLDEIATELLKSLSKPSRESRDHERARQTMSYDFEAAQDRLPPKIEIEPSRSDDLETIVVLLELAAITLTREASSSFTVEELLQEARALGGDEIELDEGDVKNVLGKAGFLKKVGNRLQMK